MRVRSCVCVLVRLCARATGAIRGARVGHDLVTNQPPSLTTSSRSSPSHTPDVSPSPASEVSSSRSSSSCLSPPRLSPPRLPSSRSLPTAQAGAGVGRDRPRLCRAALHPLHLPHRGRDGDEDGLRRGESEIARDRTRQRENEPPSWRVWMRLGLCACACAWACAGVHAPRAGVCARVHGHAGSDAQARALREKDPELAHGEVKRAPRS